MGGTLKKFNQVNWTILSLCRASDPDRAPKFKKVCNHFGATGVIEDFEDEDRMSVAKSIAPIKKLILKNLGASDFDFIFTHGQNGEYGHMRHLGVHLAIKELLAKKKLGQAQVLVFNYKKKSQFSLEAKVQSDFILKLSAKEFSAKKKVMTEIYGFDPQGIDANLCTKIEAFKKI
jgi:hypothetical protein